MAVEFRKDGITGYIKVDGRLSHGPNLEDFRARWTSAVAAGCTQIILDLSNVPSIDSSGMGNLVRCKAALDKEGGKMKIVGARAAILHALSLIRLDTMFEFYPDGGSAMASFGTGE
ncbi:MAG: STAS domain-containing protein [Acidobacteriaceae bacterium]